MVAPPPTGVAFTTIMALNVLLRADPARMYTPVGGGGNRFFGMDGRVDLPSGAVVGKGFFQSIRPGNLGSPYVNLDTAYTAFIKEGPLMEVAARVLGLARGPVAGRGGRGGPRGGRGRGGRGGFGGGGHGVLTSLNANQTVNLKRLLKGARCVYLSVPSDAVDNPTLTRREGLLRFTLTYRSPGKEFRLDSISTQSAQQIRFEDGTGAKVSLVDYFATRYNIHLLYPGMPCVVFKGGKAIVPFELIRISANHSIPPTRLTADQTADMIKVTALPPPERKANTDAWRRTLGYERAPKLRAWGVGVDTRMKTVDARVLDPPTVVYRGGQGVKPRGGAWNLAGSKCRWLRTSRSMRKG
jgi:eukaryotic translation initiation factor 2C